MEAQSPALSTAGKCPSCSFDLGRSRTAVCTSNQCGEAFPLDIELDSGAEPAYCCPFCGGDRLILFQDEPTPLCKHCLAAAMTDEPADASGVDSLVDPVASATLTDGAELSRDQLGGGACGGVYSGNPGPAGSSSEPRCCRCGASGSDNLLPVDAATNSRWTGHCSCCQLDYRVTDDSATCPMCSQPAETLLREEETPAVPEPPTDEGTTAPGAAAAAAAAARLCRRCGFVNDQATAAEAAALPKATAELRWMQNYSEELWRFMGCACDNHEPDCFDLQVSEWSTTSYYCLDCGQPYSRYLWDTELRSDQCPRCNGEHVETDAMAAGDTAIVCLKCDGRVSKRRFDGHCADVRGEVEAELLAGGGRRKGGATGVCWRCGTDGAEMIVASHNGDIRLSQVCTACGSADLLPGWRGNHEEPQQQKQKKKTPAGFEGLARCCGDLASLHPVENDVEDDLLVCALCSQLVSLAGCTGAAVPKTVSALRRALAGSFSSGEMGRPYRTVKVSRLDELKPGDQLDLKRRAYSHHAIVVETVPRTEQLAVIEYTGESNAPTVLACLQSAPSKAHVTSSLLAFRDVAKSLHRVDYHSLDCFLPRVVIQRAGSRLGEKQYHVGRSNCEHFSNWAKANVDLSRQADNFKAIGRKVLDCPIWDAAGGTTKGVIGLASTKPLGLIVDIIQDLRRELLHLFSVKKGASRQVLRMVLRLGLKWGIRGLPLLLCVLLKNPLQLSTLLQVDALVMKPIAEWAADMFLPIEDEAENGKRGLSS